MISATAMVVLDAACERGARRFMRRRLRACEAEWKLLCGTHNFLKLWRRRGHRPAATPSTA
jgi:hypothetical protein